jgi:ribosomal protein L7/L12
MKKLITVDKKPDPVLFTKFLRNISGLSLREARELNDYILESIPCPFLAGITEEKVDEILKKLSDLGIGNVLKVEDTTINTPMLLCPNDKDDYEFRF